MLPTDCDLPGRPGHLATLQVSAVTSGLLDHDWPPLKMTKAMLNWMRYHFGETSRIAHPDLKDRVWVDNESTPILIQSLAEYSPNVANLRPAILVDRLEQKPYARTLDTRRIGGCGYGTAEKQYQQHWIGQHVLYCVGGREGEAELLAGEVFKEIFGFCKVLRVPLCLEKFDVLPVPKRTKIEEFKETWSTPVGIEYGYVMSSRAYELDVAQLAKVNLTLN